MPPEPGMQPDGLPGKNTSLAPPVKKCTTGDTLIWFDWSVLLTLVILIVALSPWDIVVNAILCGVVLAVYRISLRKVWIRLFPGLYTVYSCSACSAVVPAGAERCPVCKVWFAE